MAALFDDREIQASQSRMETARRNFDALRGEIAAMLLPHHAHFEGRYSTQGEARGEDSYDDYAALALEDGVAAAQGFIMPRGQKWQEIELHDERLMKPLEHQVWLQRVSKLVFAMRNDPRSGFTASATDSWTMLLGLGMQSMWLDKRYDERGRFLGLSYESEHIDQIYVERDASGWPYRVHKKFKLTAEQAWAKWREEAPEKVREAMNPASGEPRRSEEFEFVHVIERNPGADPGRIDFAAMPWKACYYSCKDKVVFKVGGYRTLRRITSCFARASNEDYGRGRANIVLKTLRASQLIMQDRVLGTEMMVKPPLLAPSDDLDQAIIDLGPFGITYGGLDERGNEMLRTFLDSIDLNGARDLHGELHAVIDKIFYRDLMQINRELKTHITATRTMEEIAEKGILLGPLAKQEGDWFSPLLDSELDALWEEGLLDDMPPRLAAYFSAGGGIMAKYDNLVGRMQEAGEAAAFLRTGEQVAVFAQIDPTVVDDFKAEYPMRKVIPELGRINGIPARWRATEEEKAAADQAKAQEVQLQQLLAAAPALSQTAANVARAEGVGGA